MPQWPALVLDRLARLPGGSEGAARVRALAALGALLQLHQGPPVAREDADGASGLSAAAAKRRLPVRSLLSPAQVLWQVVLAANGAGRLSAAAAKRRLPVRLPASCPAKGYWQGLLGPT